MESQAKAGEITRPFLSVVNREQSLLQDQRRYSARNAAFVAPIFNRSLTMLAASKVFLA
jgi:hypothetical protein